MAQVLEQALRTYGGFGDDITSRLAPQLSGQMGGDDAALEAIIRRNLEERARAELAGGGMAAPAMPGMAPPAAGFGGSQGMQDSPFLEMDAELPGGSPMTGMMGGGMGAAPPPPAPMLGGLGQQPAPMQAPTPPPATVPGIETPRALDFESEQRGGFDILAGIGSAGETFANRMADARGAPGTRTTPIADQFRALRQSDTEARTQQAAEERLDRSTELQQANVGFEQQRSLGTDDRAERVVSTQEAEAEARIQKMQAELDAAEVEAAQTASLRDPDSPISRRAAEVYSAAFPGVDLTGLSLADINAVEAAAKGAQGRMDAMRAAQQKASAARQAALMRRSEITARKMALQAEGMPEGKAEVIAADDALLRKYLEPEKIADIVAPPPGFAVGGPVDPKEVRDFAKKNALMQEQARVVGDMMKLAKADSVGGALMDQFGRSGIRDRYDILWQQAVVNQMQLQDVPYSDRNSADFKKQFPELGSGSATVYDPTGPLAETINANRRTLYGKAIGINLIPPPEPEPQADQEPAGRVVGGVNFQEASGGKVRVRTPSGKLSEMTPEAAEQLQRLLLQGAP